MKKKIALMLFCLMMFAGVGSAFAQDVAPEPSETVAKVKKFEVLKEFQDELHQINTLRTERLGLKAQIVQKQDQILDLTLAARANGDKEALKAAAEVRKQLHVVNKEIAALVKKMDDHMKAFKQAVKSESKEKAQAHIDGAIAIFQTINGDIGQKAGLLDQMIAALS